MSIDVLDRIAALPAVPSPEVSDKYSFIDSKRVVEDMKDLGYQVAGFRRPKFRTQAGAYGLHEIDFRKPEHIKAPPTEAPRILFLNTYDGSRRAQVITGVFRLVCLNGLVAGTTHQNEKFLHLGEYEEDLVSQVKAVATRSDQVLDKIDEWKSMRLRREHALLMAEKAAVIRDPDGAADYSVTPSNLLLPRRREDTLKDLWTTWNVLQENLLKGGVPATGEDGSNRTLRAINQIQKSNEVNQGLWDLLEQTASAYS